MHIQRNHKSFFKTFLVLLLICLVSSKEVSAFERAPMEYNNNSCIIYSYCDEINISLSGENTVTITGVLDKFFFSYTGYLYSLFDSSYSNKTFLIGKASKDTDIQILDIEFETNAAGKNLEMNHQDWIGTDVLRIAAYYNGYYYYSEQPFTIPSFWGEEKIISSSMFSNMNIISDISSANTWYMHAKHADNERSNISNGNRSNPQYGTEMTNRDITAIETIGFPYFISEFCSYGQKTQAVYYTNCVEWPYGSGNYLTDCLLIAIVANTPSSENANLQASLEINRQYQYLRSLNTIDLYATTTDYRIYDPKVAIACAQNTNGLGYDYISRQHTYVSTNSTNIPFSIARDIVIQLDRSGTLSILSSIFSAFTSSNTVTSSETSIWPVDYNEHYASIALGKQINTMIRGVRLDTNGNVLNAEGTRIVIEAKIEDRDYLDSSQNTLMTKGMRFAFSFDLRTRNSVSGWLFNGNYVNTFTYEWRKTYTK